MGVSTNDTGAGSQHTAEDNITELYVVMGYLSFLSVMGTGGNALVLYVFSQKKDKLVSTLFIIVLAFVDFITCLVVIPYTIYMEYMNFRIEYDFLCKLYHFFITSNIPFSALIMVAIAIDRYFCICHPFLHAMNIYRAKIMIACLGLFALTLGVVVALIFGVYHKMSFPLPDQNYSADINTTRGKGNVDITPKSLPPYDLVSPATNTTIYTTTVQQPKIEKLVYTGHCENNNLIWSDNFQYYYQKFFMSLYIVCLVIVIVLYTLIYKSVMARRSRRQKQKSKSLPMVLSTQQQTTMDRNGETNVTEETLLTTVNGDSKVETVTVKNGPVGSKKSSDDKQNRKSTKRGDRNRMANLKTAAMLFVVTVVFIVTFFPAFLMAMRFIPYYMPVFYLYFANNVANPVIYSFMNKNFRDDLRKLFCRTH